MDYKEIGLKCGLEIHQQLDTDKKLFCSCRSALSQDKPIGKIIRKLRPVAGETGEVDIAAAHELLKNKEFEYVVYEKESCCVETDEEPPHMINTEALSIALQIAIMMNCEIPDEIHVMRKTVVDGSNTSGFQRTGIVGLNGFIETSFGKIGITNISIEEDSSQIVGKEGNKIIYGLDRLGIPLIEIGTAADIKTPEQAKEAAEKLGFIIRSTGAVKRGLGTIRQDLNLSVRGGNRVEIKGSQDLKLIPKLAETEAGRQIKLIKIFERVKDLKDLELKETDVSEIFKNTQSKLIFGILSSGGKIFGAKLSGFSGLLGEEIQPNKRFGTEVSEYAKIAGVKGLIHSDEDLKVKYNISSEEIQKIKSLLKCSQGDAFILIGDKPEISKKAILSAISRVNMELHISVPKEVRKAEDDGTTSFMRPLPGAARLYPETDVLPIKIDRSILKLLKENLPEFWEAKIERLVKEYGVAKDISMQLVKSGKSDLFEKIAKIGFESNIVFRALTSMVSEIESEGIKTENLTDELILETFKKSPKTISKEALYDALKYGAKTGKAEKIDAGLSDSDLRKTVKEAIAKNKDAFGKHNTVSILMGEVMKAVRGKADGKKIAEILKEELKGTM